VAIVKGKASLLLQASSGVHSDWDVFAIVFALCESFNVLKVSNGPSQKVCGHDWCPLKDYSMESIALARLDFLLWHIAQSDLVFRDLNLDIESGLEVGLVEAREGSAGIAGLELSAEHVVKFVVLCDGCRYFALWRVLGSIETGHDVVDGSLELDFKRRISLVPYFLPEIEGHTLPFLVVGDILGRIRLVSGLELSSMNLQLMGIEHETAEAVVVGDFGINGHGSLETELAAKLEIVEGDGVMSRLGPGEDVVSTFP
jgi:hypothetical protein